VGPSDAQDVARDVARELSSVAGELATLKGDADNWLSDLEYGALRHRLEAALVEARRRVGIDEGR
jgi:hypothetical protein